MNKKRNRSYKDSSFTPNKRRKNTNNLYSNKQANNSAENETKLILKPQLRKKSKKLPLYKKAKETFMDIDDINSKTLKTINELHDDALKKFHKLQKSENMNYQTILDNILNIYDLDETINETFLYNLKKYYVNNKSEIDESDNISDRIANLFFKYIFTLPYEKRINLFNEYNYFKKDELFLEDDRKFFIIKPLEQVFKNFIEEILKISSTVKEVNNTKSSEDYLNDLKDIFKKYQFPNASYKIPVKYGNIELMYINLIIKFQSFLAFQTDDNLYQKTFIKYDIKIRFLALNYFCDYLKLKQYDIINILYIIFCLFSFFLYYDYDIQLIEKCLEIGMFSCSRFLFQKFDEKKEYLKKIKKYIKNEIDLDEVSENYFDKNSLKIEYKGKKIDININDCFFLQNDENFLDDLINGKIYNFDFLKRKQFPLTLDENLNKDFNAHIKCFLQSNLNNEYINNLKDIPIFDGIVLNDKIFEEIKSNTLWVKFPLSKVHGLSDRDTYTIFLNNEFDQYNEKKLCNIISSKTITCGHEYNNQILRLLLFINNYKITKTTPRNTDLYKTKEYNKVIGNLIDQGDIWEYIIFGQKISNIYIMGSIFILDTNNFDLNIKQFREKFEKNNKWYTLNHLKLKLKNAKENKKNFLIKHIKDFDTNDNDYWVQHDQFIIARNNSDIDFCKSQCISFGICGTHGFDMFC